MFRAPFCPCSFSCAGWCPHVMRTRLEITRMEIPCFLSRVKAPCMVRCTCMGARMCLERCSGAEKPVEGKSIITIFGLIQPAANHCSSYGSCSLRVQARPGLNNSAYQWAVVDSQYFSRIANAKLRTSMRREQAIREDYNPAGEPSSNRIGCEGIILASHRSPGACGLLGSYGFCCLRDGMVGFNMIST